MVKIDCKNKKHALRISKYLLNFLHSKPLVCAIGLVNLYALFLHRLKI